MLQKERNRHGPEAPSQALPLWVWCLLPVAAALLAFRLYTPSLSGPFLFDDIGLPFYSRTFSQQPLSSWVSGVRPLLMLSYWINFQAGQWNTLGYHIINVVLHSINSVFIFLFLLPLLESLKIHPRRARLTAGVCSALFLVHPVQTEAVAYIAGRSELLCAVFALSALVVFIRGGDRPVSWARALAILLLYVCAVLSKEQAVVLPIAFLAIDWIIRQRSLRVLLRSGVRLYAPLGIAGACAFVGVLALVTHATTAGFHLEGIKWYEYLFTQFRVWFLYLRLALLPIWQNADYDIPLSRSILDGGSVFALAGLAILGFVAWHFRRRYALSFAGLLLFALLLAPTSSFIPLQDLAAERRVYLPLLGLLMITADVLARVSLTERITAGIVTVLLVFSALTYERSRIWGSDIQFWQDTVSQSPGKARGYTHLLYAYVRNGRCADAVRTVDSVPDAVRNTPEFLGVLGNAYACAHRPGDALEAFERAVKISPSVGRYLALAAMYRQLGRPEDGEAAEHQATRLAPKTAFDASQLENWRRTETTRSRAADFTVLP